MQRCPNCGEPHDVSVYVSGHRLACRRCALSFDVRRSDAAHAAAIPTPRSIAAAPTPAPKNETKTVDLGSQLPPPISLEPTVASHPSPPPPPVDPPGPFTPPGYLLLDLLGKGGMGEVWRARQLSLEREVAVKILAPELAQE